MCFQTKLSNVHHYILFKWHFVGAPPNMFGPGFVVILAHSSDFSFLGKAVDVPMLREDMHTHWRSKEKKKHNTVLPQNSYFSH